MTYDEAIEMKATFPNEVTYNETIMTLFIVPENPEDFQRYMSYFYQRASLVNDKTAKAFSSDKQFTINGLNRMGTWNLYLRFSSLKKHLASLE